MVAHPALQDIAEEKRVQTRGVTLISWDRLEAHKRIISAIITQDMRTRFGRTHISYLLAVLWPLGHASFVVGGYVVINKISPLGGDPAVFLGTGILPYVLCLYPSRMIAMALITNRQLLHIPPVTPMHLLAARVILETVTAFIVAILFYFMLYLFDYEVAPLRPDVAAVAVGAAIFYGISIGVFMTALVGLGGVFALHFNVLILVIIYILSGIAIPPWMMSETALSYEYYNPIFNLIQWLRAAYYNTYDLDLININGVIWSALGFLLLGLLGERYFRGKFF
jgi:capsular polysaccharide transport system permease protein